MNYWAIITGINQYQNLQPLMYAQEDALSWQHFLVHEANFAHERCILLGDAGGTTPAEVLPAYGEAWRDRINQLCHKHLQTDDLLWFFFSGYGVQFEGQDYLMPAGGDPKQIPDTAISVQWLYQQLKLAPTDNIVVILDCNRSQGALADQLIGSQTIELAKDFGIPTLLSCQPTEFTHETLAVGHGLFTTALLEAIRFHGCVTLGQISTYLSNRLPELCEHHWRPLQHPVALIPRDRQFLMVIPPEAVTHLPLTEAAATAIAATANPRQVISDSVSVGSVALSNDPHPLAAAPGTETPGTETPATITPSATPQDRVSQPLKDEQPSVPSLTGMTATHSSEAGSEDTPVPSESLNAASASPVEQPAWGFRGLRWVLSVAVFAVIGALISRTIGLPNLVNLSGLRQATISLEEGQPEAPPSTQTPDQESPSDAANVTPDNAEGGDVEAEVAPTPAETTAEADALDEGAVEAMRPTPGNLSGQRNGGIPATQAGHPLFARQITPIAAGAPSALTMAENAIADRRFSDALIWLNQVTFGQQTTDYQAIYDQVEQSLYDQNQDNQAVLASARAQAETDQVANLNRAIFQAQQIRSGEALYGDAQATIYAWSQQILALAQAEADAGNLGAAIAVADFVPRSQPVVHAEAQAAALQWQGRLAYRQIIEQAQTLPQPGQAVLFHKAIIQIRDIPAGTPEFELAQSLIQDWSQEILTIARARAAQGRIQDAIAAAQLIPSDTEVYTSAQQLIEQWQQQ